jgi:Cd2+/Zn2+-exporting ATPase
MDCPTCATVIEHALGRLDGVLEAKVSYAAERLRVEYDSEKSLHRAVVLRIEALGYRILALEAHASGKRMSFSVMRGNSNRRAQGPATRLEQ